MSFILDALRKSDAERQRTVAPGLSDVRYASRRQRRNIWPPIIAAILGINVTVMAFQYLRSDSAPAAAPPAGNVVPTPLAPGAPAASPVAPVAAPPDDIRPLAREADYGDRLGEIGERNPAPVVVERAEDGGPASAAPLPDSYVLTAPPAGSPAPTRATEPGRSAPPVETAATPPSGGETSSIVSGLPTAEQLVGTGVLDIPQLNLDLHVYSDQPARRFVVINTRKYREGAQLSEGPVLEGITSDGVILASRGQRFTLSRK